MAFEKLTIPCSLVHIRDYLLGYPTPVVHSRANEDGLWHLIMANGEIHRAEMDSPVHILRGIPPK